MRILLAQINPFIGDLPGNTAQIIAALHEARKMQAQIVLFPELVLCGYPPQDLLFFADFIGHFHRHQLHSLSTVGGIIWLCAVVDFLATANRIKIGHFRRRGDGVCIYADWF